MIEIRLYGALASDFTDSMSYDAASPAEALAAVDVEFPGFLSAVREGKYAIYTTRGDDHIEVNLDSMSMPFGDADALNVVPETECAGIEIGVSFLVGALVVAAVSIAIAFLAPLPGAPDEIDRDSEEDTRSAIAGRPQNRIAQGFPATVIYGEVITGSNVVSTSIENSDTPSSFYGPGNGATGITSGPGGTTYFTGRTLEKGGKGGGGSTRAAQEDPNSLISNATVRLVDVIAAGENEGLVNGLQSVFLDETPVQNPDGSMNFEGFALDVRTGLDNQSYVEGFTAQSAAIQKNIEVSQASGPAIHTITDTDTNRARVTIGIPELYDQNKENGDIKRTSVSVDIQIQSNGGGFQSIFTNGSAIFSGKCTSRYQRDYDINLPPGGAPWDIRVVRITADSDEDSSLRNETYFDLVTEIVDAKLAWPGIAYTAISANIRQFGSQVKKRAYHWRGRRTQVPSNYDPVTGTYSGIWDGLFKTAYHDDPAWALYDMATNGMFGAGDFTRGMVNKTAAYAISKYCNEQIPDGNGGTERRYRISAIINKRQQALDLFQQMATVFRGAVYWGTEGLEMVQDRPVIESEIKLITPSNTGEQDLAYETTDSSEEFSVVNTWYNDIDDLFALVPHEERDDNLVRKIGYESKDVTVWGSPSRGQTARAAKWLLDDQAVQSRRVSVPVGPDQQDVNPGRIIKLHDDRDTVQSISGRISAVNGSVITLDQPFTVDVARTYTLIAMMPDGSSDSRTITSFSTAEDWRGEDVAEVTVQSAFDSEPVINGIWAIESDQLALRQFRVFEIADDDEDIGYVLKCFAYDANSHLRVEQGINLPSRPVSDLPSGALGAIPNGSISILEYQLEDGDSSVPSVSISWSKSTDLRIVDYDCEVKLPGSDGYIRVIGSDELSRDIISVGEGDLSVRVRGVDNINRVGPWTEQEFTINGGTVTLPPITNLMVLADNQAIQTWLEWDAPEDTRPFKYEILRVIPGEPDPEVIGLTSKREQVINETGTYLVRTAYMQVRSVSVSITVEESDLANPIWEDIVGRPESLADLDGAALDRLVAVEEAQDAADETIIVINETLETAQEDIATAQNDAFGVAGEADRLRNDALEALLAGVQSATNASADDQNFDFGDGLTTWVMKEDLTITADLPNRMEAWSVVEVTENAVNDQTGYEKTDQARIALVLLAGEVAIKEILANA